MLGHVLALYKVMPTPRVKLAYSVSSGATRLACVVCVCVCVCVCVSKRRKRRRVKKRGTLILIIDNDLVPLSHSVLQTETFGFAEGNVTITTPVANS